MSMRTTRTLVSIFHLHVKKKMFLIHMNNNITRFVMDTVYQKFIECAKGKTDVQEMKIYAHSLTDMIDNIYGPKNARDFYHLYMNFLNVKIAIPDVVTGDNQWLYHMICASFCRLVMMKFEPVWI